MLLADISLGGLIWSLIVLFFMVQYFMLLFSVIVDLFRSHDLSGGMKAVWALCLLFFPIITLIVYLVVRGSSMTARSIEQAQRSQSALNDYMRTVRDATSGSEEIARAKALLDSGVINAAEFDALKAKALS